MKIKKALRFVISTSLLLSNSLALMIPFRLLLTCGKSAIHSSFKNTKVDHKRKFMIQSSRQSMLFKSRMFGSKRGVEGNPPGKIEIYNEQNTLPNLDLSDLEHTISSIREIIGYPTYDVSLILNEDDDMREINLETRGIDRPTDILSFQFQDNVHEPGNLAEPDFDIPEYYNLGDMIIDVPYVLRRIDEDRRYNEGTSNDDSKYDEDNEEDGDDNEVEDDDQNDYEDFVGDDDRGVSGIMSKLYDPQERIQLLLVHGMLHLVGYDHIDDEDYELMVEREEEVIRSLQIKLGKKWCD
jgi:ssRNA-specific RNase YbeY (16S rRNA maturation enzyme)